MNNKSLSNFIMLLINSGLAMGLGIVIYYTGVKANTLDAHDKKINSLEVDQRSMSDKITKLDKEIVERLVRIEEALKK